MIIDIDVEGVDPIVAKLNVFKANSRRLRPAFDDIADRAMTVGFGLAPVYGGQTRKSMKSRASNMAAKVSAGGSKKRSHGGGIYVKMNHAGTRWDPDQVPYPWLYYTLSRVRAFAVARVQRELELRKMEAGL